MSDRPGEMDERDVDERFASIVAAWEGPLPAEVVAPPSSPATPSPSEEPPVATDDAAAEAEDGHDDPESGAPGPEASEPARDDHRPPWVNPSPLDIVVPASSWRVAPPPPPEGAAAPPTRSTPTPDPDDEEHYEPPPVTLPPQEDLHFWGAVIGLVGGPLLLLYVALARPFHSDWWFAGGVVLSLAGFGLLVLRQPRHRDPTDGDDGARV